MHYQSIILKEDKGFLTNQNILNYLNKLDFEVMDEPYFFNVEFKDKSTIGVEDIKDLISWNAKTSETLKIGVINYANRLTKIAQNNLLKVLEEPSDNTLIILVIENPYFLIDTVRSRCRILSYNSSEKRRESRAEEFVNAKFLDRKKILDKLTKSESKRVELSILIEDLMEYFYENRENFVKNKNFKYIIELLEKIYVANLSQVNLKIISNLLIFTF